MGLLPVRRRRKNFERAADGSMTLMEHLYELRDRLLRACVGIVLGMIAGWFLSGAVESLLIGPYCEAMLSTRTKANGGIAPADWDCQGQLIQLQVGTGFLVKLKIAMWLGLVLGAPIWMYQLWAFVAPGLHRHERRWAYAFTGLAAPLFAMGTVLAFFVIAYGLEFMLGFAPTMVDTQLELSGYIEFITGMMLVFGLAFEFPLAALLLNVAGVVTGRKLLSWWRIVVFGFFVFAAIVTPTPDPFIMSLLALALSALYFGAVGLALLNDRRRRRKSNENYDNLADDEVSPLEYDRRSVHELDPVEPPEPIGPGEPVGAPQPIGRAEPINGSSLVGPGAPVWAPQSLDRRYDDLT